MTPKHPDIRVALTQTDGNVFALLGACTLAMRRGGLPDPELKQFMDEVQEAPSYDAALRVMMRWVEVC